MNNEHKESRDKANDAFPRKETKGLLDNLKSNLEESLGKDKMSQQYNELKDKISSTVIFEGKDKNGKVFERVNVKDILENPWNVFKGLALEFSASFPMLQEIYKFATNTENFETGLKDEELYLENLDKDYLLGKDIKLVDLQRYKLSPKENQISMNIIEAGGFDLLKGLEFYENNELGVKNMRREDYLILIRETVLQAKRFNFPTEYYVPYVLGMTKIESSFKVDAFNKSGATGIHQHMSQFLKGRYNSNKDYLKDRGIDYEFAESGVNEIHGLKSKADRSKWPANMWRYVSDIRVQSAFTGKFTSENVNKILQNRKLQRVDQMPLKDFFRDVYFCHNMGSGNIHLLNQYVYGNGSMADLKVKYGDSWIYKRIAEEKVWEKASENSMKAYNKLYGNSNLV